MRLEPPKYPAASTLFAGILLLALAACSPTEADGGSGGGKVFDVDGNSFEHVMASPEGAHYSVTFWTSQGPCL